MFSSASKLMVFENPQLRQQLNEITNARSTNVLLMGHEIIIRMALRRGLVERNTYEAFSKGDSEIDIKKS